MCWYKVGSEILPKQWPPGKHIARSRKRLILDFTVFTARVRNINDRTTSPQHIESLWILVHVCFTFPKYDTKIECLCKYSNNCFVFLNWKYTSYFAQYIFSKYWKEYHSLCKMLLLRNKSHVVISMIEVKIEM